MAIVFTDVGSRYLFSKPYAWSYELIGMYLMPAMFYFALPAAYSHGHHVCVDLLRGRMPPALINVFESIGCAATASVFGLIAWIFQASAREKFFADAVVMGVREWPSWIPDAFVALGSLAIALRLLARTLAHGLALVRGETFADATVPPIERQP
jgi:TRAP-type C4-dicarboxylate transport system permease small subunit